MEKFKPEFLKIIILLTNLIKI